MGRRKNHGRDELLVKAMAIFREYGFAGTSADMLVERIGVSRYSLYNEFGSKQGLFEEALQRYNDDVIDLRFAPLEKPGAGLGEINELLEYYGKAGAGPVAGLGCLLCNSAVEFGANDPTGIDQIRRYFARLTGAFFNSLSNAQENRQISSKIDIGQEAAHLTSIVLGMFVMIRASAPKDSILDAAKAAKAHIEMLTKK